MPLICYCNVYIQEMDISELCIRKEQFELLVKWYDKLQCLPQSVLHLTRFFCEPRRSLRDGQLEELVETDQVRQ